MRLLNRTSLRSHASASAVAIALLGALGAALPAPGHAAPASVRTSPPAPARAPVLRASEVIGSSVRHPDGQDVGTVADVVLNTRTGEISYAVLRPRGGPADDRLYAAPGGSLRADARGKLVLQASRQRLERAVIEGAQWHRDYFEDRGNVARLEEAWGQGGTGASDRMARASDLLERQLRSVHTGADIGRTEDLVLDLARQRVRFAVVNFDAGWLGSDKRVAVRFDALRPDPGSEHLAMNVDHARALQMRSFRREDYARAGSIPVNERERGPAPLPDGRR